MYTKDINTEAGALKKIIIGSVIAEYGALQMLDNTKFDLKQRTTQVISASKNVQNWFLFHPLSNGKYNAIFKKEFNKNELMLLSEIVEKLYLLDEDGLDEVLKALDASITVENEIIEK